MSDAERFPPGAIGWVDLTVPDAERLRRFYEQVVGWTAAGVEMGSYSDYNMLGSDGKPAVGICHQRGPNANIPAQWMIYIGVADLSTSLASAQRLGGRLVGAIRGSDESGRMCVVQDPAGAVFTLFQPAIKQAAAPAAKKQIRKKAVSKPRGRAKRAVKPARPPASKRRR